jgi:hypothetical protein
MRKHQTRLESLARDKHTSLLQKFVNYGQKRFITLGPGSTVVEHLTTKLKIEGSNPATGKKIVRCFYLELQWEAINRKQITRWQHVSQLKASSFNSW